MKTNIHRNLIVLLVGLILLVVSLSCAAGAAQEAPPPAVTAPAEPVEPPEPAAEAPPEPMNEEPPIEEMPPPTTAAITLPTPSPAPTLIMLMPEIPPVGEESEQPQPVIPESRRLTLEFPPVIRTGDSMRIRMQLEVDDQGNIIPTAIVEGNEITGEVVEIPNLYETHFVVAEGRLDMAGMEVQPSGIISEPLTPGQSVTFYWSVRPEKSGKYEGTAWLHLRFTPKEGGEESRIPVKALFLEIEAKSFLGIMSGDMARGVGAVGSILGSVLGFPFVDDLVKWLWGRIRRK